VCQVGYVWRAASKELGVLRSGIWMVSNLGLEENANLSLEAEEAERTLVRTVGPLGMERSCWGTCWETCPFPPVTSTMSEDWNVIMLLESF
jgi:hypothetical protein